MSIRRHDQTRAANQRGVKIVWSGGERSSECILWPRIFWILLGGSVQSFDQDRYNLQRLITRIRSDDAAINPPQNQYGNSSACWI
jgi:hypothetical protein